VNPLLYNLITAFGYLGAAAGILAYSMVSRGKWQAASLTFQVTNLAGAIAMFSVAIANGVWPSAAANVAWIGIGVVTLQKIIKDRKARGIRLPRALHAFEVSCASTQSWNRVAGQGGAVGFGSMTRLPA
jgi:hypothetical protein